MTTRHTAMTRRKAAAVALAAAAALAVAGCGEGGVRDEGSPAKSPHSPSESGPAEDDGEPGRESAEVLAEIKGDNDVVLRITDAARDSGGFVTVKGSITNNGESSYTDTALWV